jgi:hypothetical protein
MAITLEQIKVGAVFRFAKATRRVTGISGIGSRGFTVDWAYADGMARGGRTGGSQWCHYFRSEAIEELPADAGGVRTLLSGRQVPCEAEPQLVSVSSKCPSKWAMVDLETGDVWVSEAGSLKRAPAGVIQELSLVVAKGKRH